MFSINKILICIKGKVNRVSTTAFLLCQRIFAHVEDEQWNLYSSQRVLSVKGVQKELVFTITSTNFLNKRNLPSWNYKLLLSTCTRQQKFTVVFFAKLKGPMLAIPIEICMATHL